MERRSKAEEEGNGEEARFKEDDKAGACRRSCIAGYREQQIQHLSWATKSICRDVTEVGVAMAEHGPP
jgi:hypothetical protein